MSQISTYQLHNLKQVFQTFKRKHNQESCKNRERIQEQYKELCRMI